MPEPHAESTAGRVIDSESVTGPAPGAGPITDGFMHCTDRPCPRCAINYW